MNTCLISLAVLDAGLNCTLELSIGIQIALDQKANISKLSGNHDQVLSGS